MIMKTTPDYQLPNADLKLRDAIVKWLSEVAYRMYDDPDKALEDALEMMQTWGEQWIQESKERPS